VIAVLLLVLLPAIDPEDTDLELAGRAETAFQDGVKLRAKGEPSSTPFLAAVACYEQLRQRGIDNPQLEQNLGNAYFLADDLPHAILAYRRGLRLAPLDPALRQCLDDAREQVIYPDNTAFGRPPLLQVKFFLPGWVNNSILAAAVLLYGFGCAGLTRWLMVWRLRYLLGSGTALLTAGLLAFVLIQAAHGVGTDDAHPLVVIAEDGVLLRKGDNLAFPARYDTVVNRGVEGRLLFERDGWLQIELAAGEVGWVPSEYVLVDR
jgi:tetratricopeptide (TPR) repeat protein